MKSTISNLNDFFINELLEKNNKKETTKLINKAQQETFTVLKKYWEHLFKIAKMIALMIEVKKEEIEVLESLIMIEEEKLEIEKPQLHNIELLNVIDKDIENNKIDDKFNEYLNKIINDVVTIVIEVVVNMPIDSIKVIIDDQLKATADEVTFEKKKPFNKTIEENEHYIDNNFDKVKTMIENMLTSQKLKSNTENKNMDNYLQETLVDAVMKAARQK